MNSKLKIIVLVILVSGCGVNKYRNSVKVGKWVEKYNIEGIPYKNVEFYENGRQTGTWKTYIGSNLSSKEKYCGDTTYIKNYYPTRRIKSRGKSVIDRNDEDRYHWSYIGKWEYFDEKGKLKLVRIYKNGLETVDIPVEK